MLFGCTHFPSVMPQYLEQSLETFKLLCKKKKLSIAKGFLMPLLFSGFPLVQESEFALSSTYIPGKALFSVLC